MRNRTRNHIYVNGENSPTVSLRFMYFLFGIEGFLFQSVASINNYANHLYATNLNATQEQIGLIPSVSSFTALIALIPIGIIADNLSSPKKILKFLSSFVGIMYILYASFPQLNCDPMMLYFPLLALTTGLVSTYNSQWQSFFAAVVGEDHRNEVYSYRTRFVQITSIIVPLVCGFFLSNAINQSEKLLYLRVYFYICGILMFMLAFILNLIPCKSIARAANAHLKNKWYCDISEAFDEILHSKKFLSFCAAILFFYASWYFDHSNWYLAETLYGEMTEAHLSYFNSICAFTQLVMISVFAKMNRKYSVHFTILLGIAGLALCPFALFWTNNMTSPLRPWLFMSITVLFNTTPVCIPLCVIQMLLSVVPNKHRSLNISIYTTITSLVNVIFPYLGSRLYIHLGADRTAMTQFYIITMILRTIALCWFAIRYVKFRRSQ